MKMEMAGKSRARRKNVIIRCMRERGGRENKRETKKKKKKKVKRKVEKERKIATKK